MSEFDLVALGDIADIRMGQSPDSKSYTDDDRFMPFLQGCGDFSEEFPETRVFCSNPGKVAPEGSLLVSVRAPVGTTNIADQEYCIGRGLASVKSSVLPAVYLREIFNLYASFLYRKAQGSTFDAISSQDLRAFPIPVPKKKEQLEHLVDIFQSVNLEIRTTQTIIDKYMVIKLGMMADLFSRGIDPATDQLRPSVHDAPELYQETSIGLLPKEWEVCPLGSISSIASGITLGKDLSKMTTVRVPYLRVANVQDGYLDLTEVKFVDVPEAEATKYLLLYGDVLMNEGGDFDKLGRGAVWRNEVEGCCHQNHVFRVRTVQAELRPEFLAYWSASTYGKRYFILNSKQSTNLASINSTQLKAFPVAKPSLDEQSAIEDRLQSIDRMIDMCQLDVDKLKQQKSGLMRDLLTGKVPVSA